MQLEVKLPSFVKNMKELGIDESFLIAASRGFENRITEILDRRQYPNFNPNIIDERGFTALHLVVMRGFIKIVDILLKDSRVNINALDKLARHPIQLAWISGNINIAAMILNALVERFNFDQSDLATHVFLKMLFSSKTEILGGCQDISILDAYKTLQTPMNINIISSLNDKD